MFMSVSVVGGGALAPVYYSMSQLRSANVTALASDRLENNLPPHVQSFGSFADL
jgi:hypothetical protein